MIRADNAVLTFLIVPAPVSNGSAYIFSSSITTTKKIKITDISNKICQKLIVLLVSVSRLNNPKRLILNGLLSEAFILFVFKVALNIAAKPMKRFSVLILFSIILFSGIPVSYCRSYLPAFISKRTSCHLFLSTAFITIAHILKKSIVRQLFTPVKLFLCFYCKKDTLTGYKMVLPMFKNKPVFDKLKH